MQVTITQFRREIFELVGRAIEGESVSIVYKGTRLRIVPEFPAGDRLSRLTQLQVINPTSTEADELVMKAEMGKAWESDWSDL